MKKNNIVNKLPKKNNANNGLKAKNDAVFYTVGRIKFNSWATPTLKARDIIINEKELIHIEKRHSTEINSAGMNAFDFVVFIANNFNEIRKGSGESILLVVKRNNISNMAAIELVNIVENGKECYKIKTASMINNEKLKLKKLLCADVR